MFGYNRRKRERAEKEAILIEQQRVLDLNEALALRLIGIKNKMFIKSTIKSLEGRVKYTSGESATHTREIRNSMRDRIEWYTKKLTEEIFYISFYNNKILELAS